ncbi:MAG: HAD family phosphatase, partial [bacterium]|nr:HAD family phosphatase [bacterium]
MDPTTKPAAVIFDFDDTLVRTGPMIVEIYRGIFADLEIPFTDRDLAPGIPVGEFVRFVAHRHGRTVSDHQCERASLSYRQEYDARAPEIAKLLEPNAIDLLSALRAAGIRTAVASSGFGVVETTNAIGLTNYLDTVVDRDGVERGKPAPDLFLVAAERLGIAPDRCCGIE